MADDSHLSERRRADEAPAFLAAIVESSDDAIISKTLDGRILSWNHGAERLLGYTEAEAVGRSIEMIVPPERLDEERSILERLRRGERIDHYETERLAKGGERLSISLTVSPIRNESGEIVAASSIARDITARKRASGAILHLKDELAAQLSDMRRLHDMSTRLSTTLELEPILEETLRTATAIAGTDRGLLCLWDADRQVLEVGARLGFDAEFLERAAHLPPGAAACERCFQEGRRISIEDVEVDAAFADLRPMARHAGFRGVNSTPLVTRAGRIVGVLSVYFRQPRRLSDRELRLIDLCARQAVDFIENARLYAQIRDADERKSEFLAILSHELRNPLSPISNALHILRLTGDLSPTSEQQCAIMERQVIHMTRLVDGLLDVTRMSKGKIGLHKEQVELAAIVSGAVEMNRPAIDAAGHRLAIALPPQPVTLEVDRVRMTQVLSNLLDNAAKHVPAGGQIWITARHAENSAIISVRDNGPGIRPEIRSRIFDLFVQDRAPAQGVGGLGIGLALARRLVEMHDGTIDVADSEAGRGAEFTVRVPCATPVEAASAPATCESWPAECPRVLVVDDNHDSADSMAMMVEFLGYDVKSAYNGFTALEEFESFQPQIVFLDLGMPGMDGLELARQIRQRPIGNGAVLIALTGRADEDDRQRTRSAGIDHHLLKPFGLDALRELMARIAEPGDAIDTPAGSDASRS